MLLVSLRCRVTDYDYIVRHCRHSSMGSVTTIITISTSDFTLLSPCLDRSTSQLALLSQPRTIYSKKHRDRNHGSSYTSKQRPGPLNTEILHHLPREERKRTAQSGTQDCIGGNRRRSPNQLARGIQLDSSDLQCGIAVNNIVEALQEDTEDSKSCQHARCNGRHPVDSVCIPAPSKPEETAWKCY